MANVTKIDSNVTGLRYAEEQSYGVLPATPIWVPLEPNSYSDFGGNITTIARNPINPSRQRKKGVTTDLEAGGGFETDITQRNIQDILQGFFFASLRRKPETFRSGIQPSEAAVPIIDVLASTDTYTLSNLAAASMDTVAAGGSGYAVGDTITLTGGTFSTATILTVTTIGGGGAVTGASVTNPGRYSVAPTDPVAQGSSSGGGTAATFNMTYGAVITFVVGRLINASGFTQSGNNGLKRITAVTSTTVVVVEALVNETPTAAAAIATVGVQSAAGDIDVDASGSLPILTSTTLDFTTLGLVPGEFLRIGGDGAGTAFANATNNGFVRMRSIAANAITIDKAEGAMATEASTTETIQIFFGRVLKNELGTTIRRRTYNLERTLGAPDDAQPTQIQSEYLVESVPGEFSLNVPTANKATCSLSFVSGDNEVRTGVTGVKPGTRPDIEEADAFNTSSDVPRFKLALVVPGDEAPTPLFAFATEMTLSLNNNISGNKAIGVLGNFEVTAGTFEIGGSLTAYFADVTATQAVRNNSDVTLEMHLVKANAGVTVDIPLISLGGGRITVEQDQPITLPLEMPAATGAKIHANLDYTLFMIFWDYLPDAAEA